MLHQQTKPSNPFPGKILPYEDETVVVAFGLEEDRAGILTMPARTRNHQSGYYRRPEPGRVEVDWAVLFAMLGQA